MTTAPDVGEDRASGRWIVLAWLLTIPLALVLWTLLEVILPRLVRAPDLSQVGRIFLSSVIGWSKPEPLEQARYVVGIVAAFLVCLAGALACRRWIKAHPVANAAAAPWLGAVVLAIQVALCGAAVYLWLQDASEKLGYFSRAFLAGATAVAVVALAAFAWLGRAAPRSLPVVWGRWLPRALALGVLVAGLLPSLFTTANLLHAHWSVIYHTSFALEDFGAVLAGRTPLVDYTPQYQNLLPFLALPYFRLFGLGVTSFSVLMTLLAAAELTFAFLILRQVTRSDWAATLLFVPFAASGFHPMEAAAPMERYYSFNLYCQHPLRTFGPWLVALLCARHLAKPSAKRRLVLFGVGALVAVNNVDFGVPAFVASIAAVLATESAGLLPSVRRALAVLAGALAAAALAIGLFAGLCLAHSGHLPHLARWLAVQRTYVLYGFGMLPMPDRGIYWVVFATFLAAIAVALFGLARDGIDSANARERYGLLLFTGVLGFGASMYYVGRSHPWSLIVIFSFWGFALALLVWEAFCAWRSAPDVRRFRLSAVPTFLLIWTLSICSLSLVETSSPLGQFTRLSLRNTAFADRMADIASFVDRHSAPGERVVISFPYGHLLGLEAGVDNVFPFGFAGEMLTFEQVDELLWTVRNEGVTQVYGELRPEEQARLAMAGFVQVDALRPSNIPLLGGSFALWQRAVPASPSGPQAG